MFEQGYLTQQEYDDAVAEELVFTPQAAIDRVNPVYSYFTDYVIEQVIADLMDQYGYDYQVAQQMVTSGGLRIYTTVDTDMQNYVEDFYSDVKNFPTVTNQGEYPQSAAVILDPNGKILALAGGIGEKKGMREYSRATDAYRQCGSAIKPISAYLQAIETDMYTWSSKIDDSPIDLGGGHILVNHYGGYYTEPYAYTQVLDADGDVLLTRDTTPRRVISPETATIVNRLMQRVTTGPYGTGGAAPFNQASYPVAGNTGTTDDDKDQWFMGITPYYVTAIWMGYDEPERIRYTGVPYPPPVLYKSLMGPLHEGLEPKQWLVWGDVQQATYCTTSGDLAGESCPTTAVGWYKTSNMPPVCTTCDAAIAEVLGGRPGRDDEDFDGSDPDYDANSGSGRIHRSPSGLIIRDE